MLYFTQTSSTPQIKLGLVEFEDGAILCLADDGDLRMLGLVEFEDGAIFDLAGDTCVISAGACRV